MSLTMEHVNLAMGKALTRLGVALSHPAAFLAAALYGVVWALVEPHSLDMHGIVALAALFMTLFIQRAAHRDTQALHAKLDELLRVQTNARDELAVLDEQEPELIEKHRHAQSVGQHKTDR